MSVQKIYDLAVVTGSYMSQGEEKKKYKNIGSMFQSDDGSEFMAIDASFNPAGVPRKEGSDSIFVSLFTPKPKETHQQKQPQQNRNNRQGSAF